MLGRGLSLVLRLMLHGAGQALLIQIAAQLWQNSDKMNADGAANLMRMKRPHHIAGMLLGCLPLLSTVAGSGGIRATHAGQQKTGPPATPSEVISEVSDALEHSYQQYLEIPRTFWNPNEEIVLTATFSPLTHDDLIAHRYQGRWERLTAALRAPEYAGRRFFVRVSVAVDRTQKVVWRKDVPLDAEQLAADTRKLVPDNRTIRTVSDVDVGLEVRIPPAALPLAVVC
jgi:hypothetical protein